MHAAATSKVENSAQGSSCKLKFVHGSCLRTLCSLICLSVCGERFGGTQPLGGTGGMLYAHPIFFVWFKCFRCCNFQAELMTSSPANVIKLLNGKLECSAKYFHPSQIFVTMARNLRSDLLEVCVFDQHSSLSLKGVLDYNINVVILTNTLAYHPRE